MLQTNDTYRIWILIIEYKETNTKVFGQNFFNAENRIKIQVYQNLQ